MTRPNIELQIDEVVLHGFDAASRASIGDAIQREIARLLGDGVAPSASRDVRVVDAGAFHVRAGSAPAAIGAEVARQIAPHLHAKRAGP